MLDERAKPYNGSPGWFLGCVDRPTQRLANTIDRTSPRSFGYKRRGSPTLPSHYQFGRGRRVVIDRLKRRRRTNRSGRAPQPNGRRGYPDYNNRAPNESKEYRQGPIHANDRIRRSPIVWASGPNDPIGLRPPTGAPDRCIMRLLRRSSEPVFSPAPPRDIYSDFSVGWDQLEIHAQDIFSTTDGSIYATEALLRWRRSPNELWAAAMALPIAEEIGLVAKCTTWATELSLATWATSTNRASGGRLSLNLHRTQLAQEGLAADIGVLLTEHGISAHEIVLEIPDRLGPDGCRAAIETIGPLLDSGSRVSLDDHRGAASKTDPDPSWLPTGSLVKLDSAITSDCDHQLGRDIMELTADTLHAEGYEVVAEMIERPTQLAAVIQCHIGWAQGHLFAKPTLLV